MENIKLLIEYNGSRFSGWQKQPGKRTVQGEIEQAFFKISNQVVTVEGSGRTDSGVHALGQVASVAFDNKIPLKNLKKALNDALPADIFIRKVERADMDFHARFSAKEKTYRYKVRVGGDRRAIDCDKVGYFGYDVDLEGMNEVARLLVGKHNFKAFASSDASVSNFEREIFDISIRKNGHMFTFDVCGNGFLYNMVRIIVGTLLQVGSGKILKSQVEKALVTGERKLTGITMSPSGLYLLKVKYTKK